MSLPDAAEPAVTFRGISKRYGGVHALRDVSFDIAKGAIHALLGENGAGKSTLLKILRGIEQADGGALSILGHPVRSTSPTTMRELGVGMIFQELSLVPSMSAMDNIVLAREPKGRFGLLDKAAIRRKAGQILVSLSPDISIHARVSDLNAGQRQIVEIAKALSHEATILILDEPTAALSHAEVTKLFRLVTELSKSSVTIIYVSHKMDEIDRLAQNVTILRDGRHVTTAPKSDLPMARIIELMVGEKSVGFDYQPRKIDRSLPPRLSVTGLSGRKKPSNVSFSLWPGEILGIAGILGSGRSELAQVIAGVDATKAGSVELDGQVLPRSSLPKSIAAGVVLAPEDRRTQGLLLTHSVAFNTSLPTIDRFSGGFFLDKRSLDKAMRPVWARLSVRAESPDMAISKLSGGNQQKILIAKWLLAKPKVLILDEPTAGIDIKSKSEILRIIREQADAGASVIFISSEIPELLAASDRLLVINRLGAFSEIKRETIESWADGVDELARRNLILEQKLNGLMQTSS